MESNTRKMYEEHHAKRQRHGFSIMKNERGDILRKTIGVGKKVLDIGCRDGALTALYCSGNEVLGVDIDKTSLDMAESNLGIKTIEMDLLGDWVSIGGKKFDVIFAGEVLEHLFYPKKIIEKVANHLTEDGIFVGSVPNAFSLKNKMRYLFSAKKNTPLSDPTHINHFSAGELKENLSLSFKDIEIIGIGRYKRLASLFPGLFAFDLYFKAKGNLKHIAVNKI